METAPAVMTWKPPTTPDSDPLIGMIERLARDPSVDIDRMERLLAQREKAVAEMARVAWNDGMAAVQADIEPVRRDANNPQTRSRYASYAALDGAIRPTYARHGFAITFDTGVTELPDHIRVLLYVTRGAHERTYHLDVPIVTKGIKGTDMMTLTHAKLSGVTYGRRALLSMAFNIATTHDDDGNRAGGRVEDSSPISPAQLDELQKLIVETGTDINRFCAYLKVERLEEIPVSRFAFAKSELQRKARTTAAAETADADHPARDA